MGDDDSQPISTYSAVAEGSVRKRGGLTAGAARADPQRERQALEAALTEYWRRRSPAMLDCPTRAQIRCLDDPSVEQRVSLCWAILSRACHHHPYELTPGANELAAALVAVRESCDALCGDGPACTR